MRRILWGILITLGVLLLVLVFRKEIEGFDTPDPEAALRTEVNQYMTLANDTLCPCYSQILDQRITNNLPESQRDLSPSDQDPDERHKAKAKAITELANATIQPQRVQDIDPTKIGNLVYSYKTTGLLFPCPPPTDPMQIPNNIDAYITASAKVFLPILTDMKDKIEKSLSCPPKKEGFETTKYYGLSDPVEGFTIPAEAFKDVSKDPELKKQRIQTLQAKILVLKKVLLSDIFIGLRSNYTTLMELKKRAESGQIQSNCSA
jgi:hypothetical protein